jgi:RimJ/RimL family protein N-acetyltransferase
MNLEIRKAKPEDAAALLHLAESVMIEEIYSLTEPGEFRLTLAQEREWIQQKNENPNHLVIVAEANHQLVGMLELSNGHRARIAHTAEFSISVLRPYRDQGVGRRLMDEMLRWAHENPTIEKLSLKVHADNARAIHLYETLGFIREGYLKKELKYGPNRYVDTCLYSLWV